jgi:hypothetical protein
VLQEYIKQKGSIEEGLLFYLVVRPAKRYRLCGQKVSAEQAKLDQVAAGEKLSTRPLMGLVSLRLRSPTPTNRC